MESKEEVGKRVIEFQREHGEYAALVLMVRRLQNALIKNDVVTREELRASTIKELDDYEENDGYNKTDG